jgi:hypothetical protein
VSNQLKVIIGALAVVGAIIFLVALNSGDDGGDPASDENGLACAIGAGGVGLIVTGLTHGESAAQIIAGLGSGPVANYACKKAVNTLVDSPDTPVSLEIDTQEGTVPVTPTGNQLAQPGPAPPPSAQPTLLDCFRWDSGFLVRACLNGTLPPPTF